jgi:hypothetical protein
VLTARYTAIAATPENIRIDRISPVISFIKLCNEVIDNSSFGTVVLFF